MPYRNLALTQRILQKLKDDEFGTVGQLFQVANKYLLAVKEIIEAKLD